MISKRSLLFLTLLLLVACGSEITGFSANPSDIKPEVPSGIPDIVTIQDIPVHNPLDDYDESYKEECLRQVYLRCPPYTEYWIAEAWLDVCEDHAIIFIENFFLFFR